MLRRLGVADDPGHHLPNLQACLDAVLEQSPLLMGEVLAGLDALLVPQKDKKSAVADDPQLREAIEGLAEQATALKTSFSDHLRTFAYGGQSSRQAARQMMRFEDFQFLDSDQIDASIEFAQSQQAVMTAVHDVLPMLNAMVSQLLGWSSVQGHLNPLKPESFVHALREALDECVEDRAARAKLMSLASGLLGATLHQLYREITEWMRSQGVEPVHMAANASTGLWNPDNANQSTVARTMLTLDKLRSLLSGELDPNPVAAGKPNFSHTIPASFEALQDMKLVEPMMKRLADRAAKAVAALRKKAEATAEPLVAEPVVDMLAAPVEDEQAQRRKMGMQLGREVVLLMLDNLMQDTRLLTGVRASLRALEPVLVELSQKDGRLFSERQHPARLFLDRMTHRSLAFSSSESPGYSQFQAAFDVAVNHLRNGDGDAAAFAQVLRNLDEAWSKQDSEQHQRAALAARGLLHAEQRNLLAHRLGQEFTERLQGLKVPDFVASFLRGPWAQAVAQAQLNFADGTADPGGYMALVDDLVWSVQLRLIRRNRARLVQLVPEMLVTMRRGLELIGYPPSRAAAFFDDLIAFHEQVFDASRPAPLTPEPASEPVVEEAPATTPPWVVEGEASDSGYMDDEIMLPQPPPAPPQQPEAPDRSIWSVDSLSPGIWVDLALAGNWVRAQLTWTSPQRTLFMFISGSGMAHSMSRRTIDRMKKSRLIRLVSDGRIMDNALDAVAQAALQNDLQQPPAKPDAKTPK